MTLPTLLPPRLAARPAPEAVFEPEKLVTRASNGVALVGQGGEAPGSLTGKVPRNAAPRELGDRPCHAHKTITQTAQHLVAVLPATEAGVRAASEALRSS